VWLTDKLGINFIFYIYQQTNKGGSESKMVEMPNLAGT